MEGISAPGMVSGMHSYLTRYLWNRQQPRAICARLAHANSNFAVIHFFWDRILGTYRSPDAGQTQANGILRIGGPARFPPFEADPV
jgi:hypothetical protein